MFVPDNPGAVKVYEQKNAINKDASLGNYFISAEKYETLKGFEVFPNDIIVSCAGTIGETYVLPTSMRKGIINQALMKISLYDLGILDFYLMYFDFQLKRAAQEQGYGVALKNIPPFDMLKRYLVPIPPIQEQQRIIAAVNNLLFEVDSIDADSKAIFALIAQTKAKILDLAIRGQFVTQDPTDEPASVLLERIRAEKEELIKQGKIKRDKKESAIWMFDENIRIQNHIHRLRPYISLSSRFYYYVMFLWKQMGLIGGQGIGLQGFSSKALHNLMVPLPPVDEQEKIVVFVDELFEAIANIEKSLS